MLFVKIGVWLGSNRGPPVGEWTALPTEQQPLPEQKRQFTQSKRFKIHAVLIPCVCQPLALLVAGDVVHLITLVRFVFYSLGIYRDKCLKMDKSGPFLSIIITLSNNFLDSN